MEKNNGSAAERREPLHGETKGRKREKLREYGVGFEEDENLSRPWTAE